MARDRPDMTDDSLLDKVRACNECTQEVLFRSYILFTFVFMPTIACTLARYLKTHSFEPILLLFLAGEFDRLMRAIWALPHNLNVGAMAICMLTLAHSFERLYARNRRALRTRPTGHVLRRCIAEHEYLLKVVDKLRHTIERHHSIHFTLTSIALTLLVRNSVVPYKTFSRVTRQAQSLFVKNSETQR